MSISIFLKNALGLVRKNKKLLLLFWGTNAAMAILLVFPVYSLLYENLQHSMLSSKLASGFDYIWLMQFLHLNEKMLTQMHLTTYGIVGLYSIIQTFYFGGMVAVFKNTDKNHISDFFYGGVKYWYRFIRVMLISLVFFFCAFLLNNYLGDLIAVLFGSDDYRMVDFILRSIRYVLLIIFIGVVTIVSDYVKVALAMDDSQNIFYGIKAGIFFIASNFRLTVTVFLIISVLGAAGAVVYNLIDSVVPAAPYYFLLLTFILQQMLIIFRLSIRMLFCASEVLIYADLNAEFVKPDIKESTVGIR